MLYLNEIKKYADLNDFHFSFNYHTIKELNKYGLNYEEVDFDDMTPEQRETLAESLKFANLKYNDYKEVYSKAYFFKESFMMIVDAEYDIGAYDEVVLNDFIKWFNATFVKTVLPIPKYEGEKYLTLSRSFYCDYGNYNIVVSENGDLCIVSDAIDATFVKYFYIHLPISSYTLAEEVVKEIEEYDDKKFKEFFYTHYNKLKEAELEQEKKINALINK